MPLKKNDTDKLDAITNTSFIWQLRALSTPDEWNL